MRERDNRNKHNTLNGEMKTKGQITDPLGTPIYNRNFSIYARLEENKLQKEKSSSDV